MAKQGRILNQLKIKHVTTFNEVDMEHEIQVERV